MHISTDIRVSDAERQQVADLLVRYVGEGRITLGEYDERVARVYAATTRDDLRLVLSDLPKPVSRAARPNSTAARSVRLPIWQRIEGGAWLGVGVLCLVIWGLISLGAGQFTYFWPMWVIGPWGAVLALRALTGFEARGCHRVR
ncbi:DUF1707 SHOCT-like domain-containing protein [Nocardia transvalensis]|uniref:DUF1707 SHOCT-like domain-containing protein n=1 Tax=Nocardia transvalensis TaxID=37333 RepID=UPI001893C8CC|nr:DUF1707 domain-containing protein [Nocardia transvalensis]MBF6329319.1 DUF1707 domain-containing protein [Nocardia transvalensis]